jgi:hypothetical protein
LKYIRQTPEQKEQHMKRIIMITLFALSLVVLAGLAAVAPRFRPLAEFQGVVRAAGGAVLTFDLAADCRTFVGGPNRDDPFMINGKVFPAGTLPSGAAINDPTQSVNGVKPIGNWAIRGRNSFPFQPAVAAAYSSTPVAFGTEYLILDDERTLTYESYRLPSGVVLSSVTGGTGGFSGAAGQARANPSFGTNATGCPNGRVTFTLHPGSVRGDVN